MQAAAQTRNPQSPGPPEPEKSFKQHLDECTNLITIFGILNALIIFANQASPGQKTESSLQSTGAVWISVSMYILSLLVLWEIIWQTINTSSNNFKFKVFYFLLCMTSLGVGMLFLSEYYGLIISLGLIAVFLVTVYLGIMLSTKLFSLFITRRNSAWIIRNINVITFLIALFSIIVVAFTLKYLTRFVVSHF